MDDPKGRGYTVYRLFDLDGNLLYVGMTGYGFGRMEQHRHTAAWFNEVASARFEHFATKEAALQAEKTAMREGLPKHNGTGTLWPVNRGGQIRRRKLD